MTALAPVTVVIPVFNLDRYVGDAIRSVLAQDFRGPMAIVILDDGSTDDSLAVINQCVASENANENSDGSRPISVHSQSNGGRAKSRNRLLQLAQTDFVAWLDGDDLASPSWIREQVEYLQQHPNCVAVSAQGYSMTASGHAIGPLVHPLDGVAIDERHIAGDANAFFQSCVLTRKSAVEKVGRYDESFPVAEDYSLWLRLAEVGNLANLGSCHLFYRVHAASANWTANVGQRNQGEVVVNQARLRRGLAPLPGVVQEIPPPKKDDWNRRLYWINIALKSGNPVSALQMLPLALRRHPLSLVMWLAAFVSVCDTVLFRGNRTKRFRPGVRPELGDLPMVSAYRLGRWAIRLRRRFKRSSSGSG